MKRPAPSWSVKRMTVHDLKEQGAVLLHPGHPEFEFAVDVAVGNGRNEFVEALKDISIILLNKSQTIIGYSINWVYTSQSGRSLVKGVTHANPGALLDPGQPAPCRPESSHNCGVCIDPGGAMLISAFTTIGGPNVQRREGWLDESIQEVKSIMKDSNEVTVVLDGVMFDNGTFGGRNANKLFESIVASFDAVQGFYRRFLDSASQPLDSVKFISKISEKDVCSPLSSPPPPTSDVAVTQTAQFYRGIAVDSLLKAQRAGGLAEALMFARSRLYKKRPTFANLGVVASAAVFPPNRCVSYSFASVK